MNSGLVKIRTTVLCLPVSDPGRSLAFYQNVFGYRDAAIEDGIIALELPSLSLFLMERTAFEAYSRKAGRGVQFPGTDCGAIISCAMTTRDAVEAMMKAAPSHGGSVSGRPAIDEASGGYTGYVTDPDGYLWELVFPLQRSQAADAFG
ncbi:MAG: VOC family protein [Pannonibacter indicus]